MQAVGISKIRDNLINKIKKNTNKILTNSKKYNNLGCKIKIYSLNKINLNNKINLDKECNKNNLKMYLTK